MAKPPKTRKKNASRRSSRSPEVMPAESPARPRSGALDDIEDAEFEESDAEEGPSDAEIAEDSRALAPRVEIELDDAGASVSALSPTDPLRRYFDELKHYPLLDPQEEFELAMRLQKSGDIEAAKRLVQANLRLVVKIAMEYRSLYTNLLDLIQEGNVGLMKAVSKFDPAKGARLGYYASWWIRSYILKYLLDNFRLVKIGTTQAQKKLFYHLMREKQRMEAQGLLAGPKLLAEKLDVREKDVVEMEQRLSGHGSEVPLDAPIDPGSERPRTLLDQLEEGGQGADDALAQAEMLSLLESRLPDFEKILNDKERRILKDRLLAEEPKTLQEVADLYGLTRERARQIEAKVILKLRDFLAPHFG